MYSLVSGLTLNYNLNKHKLARNMQKRCSLLVVAFIGFLVLLSASEASTKLLIKQVLTDRFSSARWLSIANEVPLNSGDRHYQHYMSQDKVYLRAVQPGVTIGFDFKLPSTLNNITLGISCGLQSDQETLCVWGYTYNSTSNCLYNARLYSVATGQIASSYCFTGFPEFTHLIPDNDNVLKAENYYLISAKYIAVVQAPEAYPIYFIVIDEVGILQLSLTLS